MIVKNYVLPMFETDEKRNITRKWNKLGSVAGGGSLGKKFKFEGEAKSSVYGELKLSEQLANQLQLVRDEVYGLQESLEEAIYQRDSYRT